MSSFEKLAKNLKINFKNLRVLETSLTHRSYLNEHRQVKESNERLEFLGDAVLELIISFFLFKKYRGKTEGELTSLRSKIVQTKTLAGIAKKLGLPQFLRISKGERESGGTENESILADSFEAVLGAIFVDQGMATCRNFVQEHLLKYLGRILTSKEVVDYKSQYQEIIQSLELPTPFYKVIAESGPDHNKIFTVAVFVERKKMAQGEGKSKQAAEQKAAKMALEKLGQKKG